MAQQKGAVTPNPSGEEEGIRATKGGTPKRKRVEAGHPAETAVTPASFDAKTAELLSWAPDRVLALAMTRHDAACSARGVIALPQEVVAALEGLQNMPSHGTYVCIVCKCTKTTRGGLEYHLRRQVCVKKRPTGRTSLNPEAEDESSGDAMYKCPLCERRYTSQMGIKGHILGRVCTRGARAVARGSSADGLSTADDDEEDEDGGDEDELAEEVHVRTKRGKRAVEASQSSSRMLKAASRARRKSGLHALADGGPEAVVLLRQALESMHVRAKFPGNALAHLEHQHKPVSTPVVQTAGCASSFSGSGAPHLPKIATIECTAACNFAAQSLPSGAIAASRAAELQAKQGLPWLDPCFSAVIPLGAGPVCALDISVPAEDGACWLAASCSSGSTPNRTLATEHAVQVWKVDAPHHPHPGPALQQVLLHYGGSASDVAWCPHARNVLAVATGDGYVRIYGLPSFSSVPAPVLRTRLLPSAILTCASHRPVCMRWHPSPARAGVLLVGCSSGAILEFHTALEGASPGFCIPRDSSTFLLSELGLAPDTACVLPAPPPSLSATLSQSVRGDATSERVQVFNITHAASYGCLLARGVGSVRGLSWHPTDDSLFASAHSDGVLRLWDRSGPQHPSRGSEPTADITLHPRREPTGVDFSALGTSVLVSTVAGDVIEVSLSDGSSWSIVNGQSLQGQGFVPPPAWDVRCLLLPWAAGEGAVQAPAGRSCPSATLMVACSGDGWAGVLPLPAQSEHETLMLHQEGDGGSETVTAAVQALGFEMATNCSPGAAAALGLDRHDAGLYAHTLCPRQPPLSAWVALHTDSGPHGAHAMGVRPAMHLPQQATLRVRLATGTGAGAKRWTWAAAATADGLVRIRAFDARQQYCSLDSTDKDITSAAGADFISGGARWFVRAQCTLAAAATLRTCAATQVRAPVSVDCTAATEKA